MVINNLAPLIKGYSTSPNTALESVLFNYKIYAEKYRDAEIIDIPKAFIQTSIEDEEYKVILLMRGNLDQILMVEAPEIYCKYINVKKKG